MTKITPSTIFKALRPFSRNACILYALLIASALVGYFPAGLAVTLWICATGIFKAMSRIPADHRVHQPKSIESLLGAKRSAYLSTALYALAIPVLIGAYGWDTATPFVWAISPYLLTSSYYVKLNNHTASQAQTGWELMVKLNLRVGVFVALALIALFNPFGFSPDITAFMMNSASIIGSLIAALVAWQQIKDQPPQQKKPHKREAGT